MASPNFDALVVRTSVALDDPVSSAGDDGLDHKSVDRVLYLNQGSLWLWNILYQDFTKKGDARNLILNRFTDFFITGTYMTDSASKFTLSDSMAVELLSATRVSDQQKLKVIRKQDVPGTYSKNSNLVVSKSNSVIYLDAGNVQALPVGAFNNAVNIEMTYLRRPDISRTVNYLTDIEWNITFWDILCECAIAMMVRHKFGDKNKSDAILSRIERRFQWIPNLISNPITRRVVNQ